MKKSHQLGLGAVCACFFNLVSFTANAAVVIFDDITLATGPSYTDSGLTMDVVASNGGAISTIGSGQFTGLYLGLNTSSFGTYTFSFSEQISSIEIQFDALSSTNGEPPETISGFNSGSGAPVITYTNLAGTSFDGTTVVSMANDGRGIIQADASPFSWYSFDHAQNPAQNGFVIEQITITTSAIPVPPAIWLFGSGLLGLIGIARRKKAA